MVDGRARDARGALSRSVVPPGTCLGPQLQLVDGGHTLRFLQAPTRLGDVAGPGSPRGLTPHSRPLSLPSDQGGSGLRDGLWGCFGDPAAQPHRTQGLPPTGELLHHLAVARGPHLAPAPLEPLAPPTGATGSPWFICWPLGAIDTPSLWAGGRAASLGPLGNPPSITALAPICKMGQRGGGPGDSWAGFGGGFNAAVLFQKLAGGILG